MSRNRINIARELEKYLDDLDEAILDCIDDQRDDREREISRLDLNPDNLLKCGAQVMEVLYFDDGVSVTRAIEDAAQMTVNASIYATLKRNRKLDDIPRDLEDELKDDFDDVSDMTESRSSRSRDRERESRRDSRRDAAGSGRRSGRDGRSDRDDRDQRSSRDRDEDRRRDREDDQRRVDERQRRREGGNSRDDRDNDRDRGRDDKVKKAQENLDEFAQHVITKELIQSNPTPFCLEGKHLALGPVYWLGSQVPVLEKGQVTFNKAGENVEWEKHRTDLYLKVRKDVKPTSSLRDTALSQAFSARDQFVLKAIEKHEAETNVVTEQKPVETKQVFTSDQILGKFYGDGTALAMIQAGLQEAGLRYLPNHPVIMKIEHYPVWVMNESLTEAVEDLLNVQSLSNLVPALIKVSNECDPQQWSYFHDQVTNLINQILKVELDSRPYLTSIITEWGPFAKWIENHNQGTLVLWFSNNLNRELRRIFHVYKHGSTMAHTFVKGDKDNFASISNTVNLIYVPVSSENFGAASPTKLGRVLESVTPKLYNLLAKNTDTTCARNLLVTQSDEYVPVYSRQSALTTKVILMGECDWS